MRLAAHPPSQEEFGRYRIMIGTETFRAAAWTTMLALLPWTSATAGGPPQGVQTDADFAASYAAFHVTNVSATTQRVSCYTPELEYFAALQPEDGYLEGGMTLCDRRATTGEDLGPYPTQDVANRPMLVKDKSESDIRIDPTNPKHVIGQSKWAISAEGYNHLLGFYESFDGGKTWPVQGHVPGYEGWTDNTDPIGAFDPWGNFYSLVLPYQFYYDKSGFKKYDNGSKQTNPTVPPEAIAMAVHPAKTLPGKTPAASWITTHNGQPDYLMTAKNANTNDPDKQWLTIDTNPTSPSYGRVYAMWTLFVINPSVIFESHADARPDGTHTDWTAPQVLPTVPGKRWDTYMLPQVTPDGTVWTTTTNNPQQQDFSHANVSLIWSKDGGATWQGPLPVVKDINVPTFQNTTFREGIVNTFAVASSKVGGHYPLYVAFEDGTSGLSNLYLTASYDSGRSWTTPIRINDNAGPTEAMQPNLDVAPNGTVAVAFYDRRLACPALGGPDEIGSGIAYDPGTAASPGTPWGRSNYCVNTAIQFYQPDLTPIGHNIRLSQYTWDPQLSALHPSCICSAGTFIGDYFGIDSGGGYTYVTSVSTFDHLGENPFFHQQQIVAKLQTP
jgi:hypothetical protein